MYIYIFFSNRAVTSSENSSESDPYRLDCSIIRQQLNLFFFQQRREQNLACFYCYFDFLLPDLRGVVLV